MRGCSTTILAELIVMQQPDPGLPTPSPGAAESAPPDATTQKPLATQSRENDVREIGGRDGPEPTRFGDWERNGRCIDF
jgi:hypothetical protein